MLLMCLKFITMNFKNSKLLGLTMVKNIMENILKLYNKMHLSLNSQRKMILSFNTQCLIIINKMMEQNNVTMHLWMKRNMMSRSNLLEYIWGEAIKTLVYISNRIPSKFVSMHHFVNHLCRILYRGFRGRIFIFGMANLPTKETYQMNSFILHKVNRTI